MPNWCENNLTIKGDSKEMSKFYDFVGVNFIEGFSMEKIRPVPDELKQFDESQTTTLPEEFTRTGNLNDLIDAYLNVQINSLGKSLLAKYGGYSKEDWEFNNWGTNSDMIFLKIIYKTPNEICLYYFTSYSENDKFIQYLSYMFKNLTFELVYVEPNCGYAGKHIISNGNDIHKSQSITIVYPCTNDGNAYLIANNVERAKLFRNYYLINIVGNEWKLALSNFGYTIANVINWNSIKNYFEKRN